jgi:hypothetical protein
VPLGRADAELFRRVNKKYYEEPPSWLEIVTLSTRVQVFFGLGLGVREQHGKMPQLG